MDRKKISHDILNGLERLRIMHDLIRDQNYESIPREEIVVDLKETLKALENDFEKLLG